MLNYDRLIKQLIEHEGLELMPYVCPAGKLTIGVGLNIESCGISEHEARVMLKNDIKECAEDLASILPLWDEIGALRQIALIDMRFNLGHKGFLGFKKMIQAIKEGDWYKARLEALDSQWAIQVGARAIRVADEMGSNI